MGFNFFETTAKAVNHRTLKNEQGRVFREEVRQGRVVPIENNRKVDAYLVPAGVLARVEAAAAEADRLKAALPLLVAAARTGVMIPSQTLETLGLGDAFDWRALNEFQAAFPVRLTHSEDGAPMPAPITDLRQELVPEEPDEELIILD